MSCFKSPHVKGKCERCGVNASPVHVRIVTAADGLRGFGYSCEAHCPICGCKAEQAATLEQTVASSQPAKRVSLAA
jgi:hypothetical protein